MTPAKPHHGDRSAAARLKRPERTGGDMKLVDIHGRYINGHGPLSLPIGAASTDAGHSTSACGVAQDGLGFAAVKRPPASWRTRPGCQGKRRPRRLCGRSDDDPLGRLSLRSGHRGQTRVGRRPAPAISAANTSSRRSARWIRVSRIRLSAAGAASASPDPVGHAEPRPPGVAREAGHGRAAGRRAVLRIHGTAGCSTT